MGQPGRKQAVSPERVLEVLQESDELFLATKEIYEELPASRPTVLDRLGTLEDEGAVRSKEIGKNKAWYLPERENYRLVRFADNEGVSLGELQELLDKYGGERIEEVIKILEEHDTLDDADIEVLQTTASALAQGRDRERVIQTLETPEITPGWERKIARGGLTALLAGGFGLTYWIVSLLFGLGFPGVELAGPIAIGGGVGGTVLILLSIIVWNFRLVGRSVDIQVLWARGSRHDRLTSNTEE